MTMRRMLLGVAGLPIIGLVGWIVAGYFSSRAVPSPGYDLVAQRQGYQVRRYNGYIVAETEVRGGYMEALRSGFRTLAEYINGNNSRRSAMASPTDGQQEESERIPMHAPVFLEARDDSYVISFVLPSRYSLETAPEPKDPSVKLRHVPASTIAALQFPGYADEFTTRRREAQLKGMMERDGMAWISNFRVAQYDPPWTPPFMRHNEVQVDTQVEQIPTR